MKITLYPKEKDTLLEILSLLRQKWPDIRFTSDGLVGGTPPRQGNPRKQQLPTNIIFFRAKVK